MEVLRVRQDHVEWVLDRMTDRDMAVLVMLEQVRTATGDQIQRVLFRDVKAGHSRDVVRARVLKRLCGWRVIAPIHRAAGGIRRGKAGYAYTLDVAGHRIITRQRILTMQRADTPADPSGALAAELAIPDQRARPPRPPGTAFLAHALAVTEIYVRLRVTAEQEDGGYQVAAFAAEPDSWWPPHPRGATAPARTAPGAVPMVKPDAYTALRWPTRIRHAWIEVDMGTEHLSAVKRQLNAYATFARSGQPGPGGVLPRVLFATVTDHRAAAIRAAITQAGPPVADFATAERAVNAVGALTGTRPAAPPQFTTKPELGPPDMV